MKLCDVCGSIMREGELGEARWICENVGCEKADPSWPFQRLQKTLQPLNDEIDKVSVFSKGKIELNTVRWLGDGSFTVSYLDGTEIDGYVEGPHFFPDIPEIDEEIRGKVYQLIELNKKINDLI